MYDSFKSNSFILFVSIMIGMFIGLGILLVIMPNTNLTKNSTVTINSAQTVVINGDVAHDSLLIIPEFEGEGVNNTVMTQLPSYEDCVELLDNRSTAFFHYLILLGVIVIISIFSLASDTW